MASYDSDSSLEDPTDYTETSVLLGYASKEATEDAISHLGGVPTWLNPQTPPSGALAKCKACKGYMSLFLQLNGDLPSRFPDDERRLHIFGCRRKACARKSGSIRAFREIQRYKSGRRTQAKPSIEKDDTANAQEEKKVPRDLGAAIFGTISPSNTNANPFSTSIPSNNSQATTNPFAPLPPTFTLAAKSPQPATNSTDPPIETFASKLKITSTPKHLNQVPREAWPEVSSLPQPYPHLHLDADYESLAPSKQTQTLTSSSSRPQYDLDDNPALEKDTFESSLDATFLRFSDRLAQNPEQVLRYDFAGTPLLYSGVDAVAQRFGIVPGKPKAHMQGIPPCEACGAKRVFELQLVPGLISALEENNMDLEEGMEWGTMVLGVCADDCGEVGEVSYHEEWVGVQWEERMAR